MKGRRVYPTDFLSLEGIEPGDYWKDPVRGWEAACPVPRDDHGFLLYATLIKHSVIEHEDGTITVSPSIECKATGGSKEWEKAHYYHGWLEHGEWRSA